MKSIIFNEAMVNAWMAGKKTVTRRLMKPQPDMTWEDGRPWWNIGGLNGGKPPYLPGETVYIRETWRVASVNHSIPCARFFTVQFKDFHVLPHPQPDQSFFDKLIENDNLILGQTDIAFGKWHPSIHMPEWAARSHALIVSVSPERVREITEAEADREGFNGDLPSKSFPDTFMGDCGHLSIPECFGILWSEIYPGSWERNDWVWRIELQKVAK